MGVCGDDGGGDGDDDGDGDGGGDGDGDCGDSSMKFERQIYKKGKKHV